MHLAYEAYFISNLVSLGLTAFLFALTAIKEMQSILHAIDAQCGKHKSKRKQLQALNYMREFIQMHSGIKELSIKTKVDHKIFAYQLFLGGYPCFRPK